MPRSPVTGIVAGRWRLVREIGRGAFGTVLEAWDEKIGRRVAVKLVDPRALELAGGMHRFNREAKVLQHLAHPNIVRAFDAGEHEGTPYLVMEFLEGAPLDATLRAHGAMPLDRVATIATDLLGALEEAHRFGVVHRDIKPANVFLTTLAGRETAKLLDFGIAKADGLDVAQTALGATLGTAAYMAPEQVTGGKVGPPTDLFAVGLLIAETLTGARVYAGGSGLAILVAKAAGKPVEVPPTVAATPLGPVVARAVAVDPSARFSTAREMASAIDAALGRAVPVTLAVNDAGADPLGATAPTAEIRRAAAQAVGAAWSLSVPAPQPSAPDAVVAASAAHAFAVGPTHFGDEPARAPTPSLPSLPSLPDASEEPRTTRAPLPSRRRLWLSLVAVGLLIAGAVAVAIVLWGDSRSPPRRAPRRSGTRVVLERPDGPIFVIDVDRHETHSKSDFPLHAIVPCPRLAAASLEDVAARLRSFGAITPDFRGEIITVWTAKKDDVELSFDHYRLGAATIEGLDRAVVVASLAERLRVHGPVLHGGANVLSLPPSTSVDVARKVLCE